MSTGGTSKLKLELELEFEFEFEFELPPRPPPPCPKEGASNDGGNIGRTGGGGVEG
jgi:hypothetical protein